MLYLKKSEKQFNSHLGTEGLLSKIAHCNTVNARGLDDGTFSLSQVSLPE